MASFDAPPFGLFSEWLTFILRCYHSKSHNEDCFGDLSGTHRAKESSKNCQNDVSALLPP